MKKLLQKKSGQICMNLPYDFGGKNTFFQRSRDIRKWRKSYIFLAFSNSLDQVDIRSGCSKIIFGRYVLYNH